MRSFAALGAVALCSASPAISQEGCGLDDAATVQQGRAGSCGFVPATRSFRGTPAQQAECLTRAVGRGAAIGGPTLTGYLRDRVGNPTGISTAQLSAYIGQLGVTPAQLGGAVNVPVTAAYFIIHDTSTPNCSEPDMRPDRCPVRGVMPPGRDGAEWAAAVGFHGHPRPFPNRLAHAFTNRIGESITEVEFNLHIGTTKFERCADAAAKRGLFIGIENVQPRVGEPPIPPAGARLNDRVGPIPGFTPRQYDRLALFYVAASVRKGRWMIPAFHAVIDSLYSSGHDDPQNFDMGSFSEAVRGHVERLAQ
jgi:hypothetical protein